jgi:DNA-binding transcriptional ArsR family regulator
MVATDMTLLFRALGDPTRLRIFEFLCARCCPVALGEAGEVHQMRGATVGDVCCHITGSEKFSSTISFHIKELRLAGLICAEKDGKFMVCSVRREAVAAMTEYLAALPSMDTSACTPTASMETLHEITSDL